MQFLISFILGLNVVSLAFVLSTHQALFQLHIQQKIFVRSGSPVFTPAEPVETQKDTEEEENLFNDLDDVEWAKKYINELAKQNVIFALAVKFIVLILGAVGIANMWLAVFADVGVAVICIINSMRCLNVKKTLA